MNYVLGGRRTNKKLFFRHLTNLGILHALPMAKWYSSCFAGVLPKLSLIRIWDKICGGKSKEIIVFVFIVLFITQRVKVFRFKTTKDVLDLIDHTVRLIIYKIFRNFFNRKRKKIFRFQIKDNQEKGDLIVTKSIEMWQENRSHRSQNDWQEILCWNFRKFGKINKRKKRNHSSRSQIVSVPGLCIKSPGCCFEFKSYCRLKRSSR